MKVADIELRLDHLLASKRVEKYEIDDIVRDIGMLFDNCTKDTFGHQKIFPENKRSESKLWFNYECKRARNLYHKTRQMYNKYKTSFYKEILKIVSKKYKKHYHTTL